MGIVIRTLSDQAFDVIRERILLAQIPPSTPIRQDALAKDLGISKIPLREALSRLEEYGLLRSNANRGYYVPPLSVAEAEDVFTLRLKIEPDAVAYACREANAEDSKQAELALATLEEMSLVDAKRAVFFNRAFHLALLRPGGHQVTCLLLERLHVLAERYTHIHLTPIGRNLRANREHRDILKAWMKRDADKVRALTFEHINGTLEDLRKQLQDSMAPGRSPELSAQGPSAGRVRPRRRA